MGKKGEVLHHGARMVTQRRGDGTTDYVWGVLCGAPFSDFSEVSCSFSVTSPRITCPDCLAICRLGRPLRDDDA